MSCPACESKQYPPSACPECSTETPRVDEMPGTPDVLSILGRNDMRRSEKEKLEYQIELLEEQRDRVSGRAHKIRLRIDEVSEQLQFSERWWRHREAIDDGPLLRKTEHRIEKYSDEKAGLEEALEHLADEKERLSGEIDGLERRIRRLRRRD